MTDRCGSGCRRGRRGCRRPGRAARQSRRCRRRARRRIRTAAGAPREWWTGSLPAAGWPWPAAARSVRLSGITMAKSASKTTRRIPRGSTRRIPDRTTGTIPCGATRHPGREERRSVCIRPHYGSPRAVVSSGVRNSPRGFARFATQLCVARTIIPSAPLRWPRRGAWRLGGSRLPTMMTVQGSADSRSVLTPGAPPPMPLWRPVTRPVGGAGQIEIPGGHLRVEQALLADRVVEREQIGRLSEAAARGAARGAVHVGVVAQRRRHRKRPRHLRRPRRRGRPDRRGRRRRDACSRARRRAASAAVKPAPVIFAGLNTCSVMYVFVRHARHPLDDRARARCSTRCSTARARPARTAAADSRPTGSNRRST